MGNENWWCRCTAHAPNEWLTCRHCNQKACPACSIVHQKSGWVYCCDCYREAKQNLMNVLDYMQIDKPQEFHELMQCIQLWITLNAAKKGKEV